MPGGVLVKIHNLKLGMIESKCRTFWTCQMSCGIQRIDRVRRYSICESSSESIKQKESSVNRLGIRFKTLINGCHGITDDRRGYG